MVLHVLRQLPESTFRTTYAWASLVASRPSGSGILRSHSYTQLEKAAPSHDNTNKKNATNTNTRSRLQAACGFITYHTSPYVSQDSNNIIRCRTRKISTPPAPCRRLITRALTQPNAYLNYLRDITSLHTRRGDKQTVRRLHNADRDAAAAAERLVHLQHPKTA